MVVAAQARGTECAVRLLATRRTGHVSRGDVVSPVSRTFVGVHQDEEHALWPLLPGGAFASLAKTGWPMEPAPDNVAPVVAVNHQCSIPFLLVAASATFVIQPAEDPSFHDGHRRSTVPVVEGRMLARILDLGVMPGRVVVEVPDPEPLESFSMTLSSRLSEGQRPSQKNSKTVGTTRKPSLARRLALPRDE